MQATQAPPRLPGVRATTLFLISALVTAALFLPLWALLIGLMSVETLLAGGHWPWPVAQWALTTPAGLLAILAICVGICAPSLIAMQRLTLRRWALARAVDVTEVPPWIWLTRPPVYPGETRADRWLGRGRRAHMVSLTLLGAGALLCLLLIASFLASGVVSLMSIPHAVCGVGGCPPMYPLFLIVLAGEWVIFAISSFVQYRWLRRIEASSGVWLRYRDWFQTRSLYYIRQPGVLPEAAVAALARFAPAEAMPLARMFAIAVLGTVPLCLLLVASFLLQFWLATQWLPG